MTEPIWNNKDFCLSSRGGRARVEKMMPFQVVDARGVVLASCPDAASAAKFARAVADGGEVEIREVRE
jgi:hypothetical protein